MIMEFLSGLGVPKWQWLGLASIVVAGLITWALSAEKADDKANQELGATRIENKALETTLERVEKANEVRATTAPGDRSFYDECLRTARTPSRCERFLPTGQNDLGGPGAP